MNCKKFWNYHIFTIMLQNYGDSKHNPYNIMKTQIWAIYENVEPSTKNKTILNLAMFTLMAAKVAKPPL
jgi:hypothetical protein